MLSSMDAERIFQYDGLNLFQYTATVCGELSLGRQAAKQ
jgi:hypothetical protein